MIQLGNKRLNLLDIEKVVYENEPVMIHPEAHQKLHRAYELIAKVAQGQKAVYGINTGFGALAEHRITKRDQETLQRNIIVSHAVGVGPPLDFRLAKLLILLRLNTLVQAHSGASPGLINHLLQLLNANCAPLVPKKGSVGASGDLAPLAHLGLLLLGLGDALVDNQVVSSRDALQKAKLEPLNLGVRDGLALINGTQAMASLGLAGLRSAHLLSNLADIAAASSLDALGGHLEPFSERIHELRPHPGQGHTAKIIRHLTTERSIPHKSRLTQDPYSLRCVPQVHGATKDVLAHAQQVLDIEINAVTDNPLFFFNENMTDFEALSGGNFHGQILALMLDYLAMGISELANIAERRIELLLNEKSSNGLPAFLIENSGLNSGFMMLHVTASSLVNENKVLCHPASVDSIPTSANREDHVAMGMTSGNKLMEVIANTQMVLAIELLASHQALDFRQNDCAGMGVRKFHQALRSVVSFRSGDGLYGQDVQKLLQWLDTKECTALIKDLMATG